MKHLLLCLACLAGGNVLAADPLWLTISGDQADSHLNTVEVNPVPLEVQGDLRTMSIRVSRSSQRSSWEGIPYRSYYAMVTIDCKLEKAYYLSLDYYLQPAWKGRVHKKMSYTRETAKPMLFVGVTPNPTARIIKAACV